MRFAPAALLPVVLIAAAAAAEDWPQWRGPRSDGSSLERSLPTSWSRDRDVCWSIEIPGEGHSSPIVARGSVFVTTALGDGRARALLRVDAATGKVLWSRVVAKSGDLESLHHENAHASSTPAADHRAIYTSFYANGRTHLAATDYEGRALWAATPLRYRSQHGYHHNPLLLGDQLVLAYEQLADAAVLSLDTTSGKERWRVPLANDQCSNAAPFPVRLPGRTLVVTVGNDLTRAIDASTGKVVFQAAGPTDYCVAGPAFGAGNLFVNGGYPDRRSLSFRFEGPGAFATAPAWETRKGTTYVPSPVFHEGTFYALNDGGLATAWDARTGEVRWQERLRGRYRASLVLAEGRLYGTNDAGLTTIFRASPVRYEVVGTGDLGEFVYATPALADGRIFVRTENRLHAIGECTKRAGRANP